MNRPPVSDDRFVSWLVALEQRHLADLTLPEVGRALRALSSCYVERRSRLAEGAALEGTGKRAAFALFYAPLHFLIARHVVAAVELAAAAHICDLGCGTGSAGAAWALSAGASRVTGWDRHPWAVAEANWTYRQLAVKGRAIRQDLTRAPLDVRAGAGVILSYALNELPDQARDGMLVRLLDAHRQGAAVVVIEPIARRMAPWWKAWQAAFEAAGGRSDEWRFPSALPPLQRQLAKSAGLNPQELTARTLIAPAGTQAGRKP